VDGDGIPYRTLPGNLNPKSGYFARGTSHDEYAHYTEAPDTWERVFNRIARKFETALQYLPKPEAVRNSGAPLAILSSGSAHPAVIEALDMLEAAGLKCDYLRLRSIPFAEEVADFLTAHTNIFVVEANRDGQLLQLLTMKYPQFAERMVKEAHMDGLPLTAKWIFDQIMTWEKEK
jgi:2-oxoglutarate ferredoxin oxidoreductase subunit alpha